MAGVNHSMEVPTWFDPTFSDTNSSVGNDKMPCRGFEVWSAGIVKWTDITDYTQSRTFAAPFPIRITGAIKRIWSSTTSVTTTDIVGLR